MKHRSLRLAFLLWVLLSQAWGVTLYAQINTDHVMIMGRNALYYEDYVLSIQRFNMVIHAKPFLAEPYFYRALAKFYLEDYAGADSDCSSAIERNPYAENHYVLRGLCRVNLQRYASAEEDYRMATSINPMNSTCWHNMVLCEMEQKAYDRADSSLNVMIRQWPQNAANYTMKAQVSFARMDTVAALDWIARALDVDAFNGQAWSMRAMVALGRGMYKQGEEALDKAIVQLPRNAGLYINRALARFHQQNLRGAMSDYDAGLEIEPGNYLGHFNRGLLRAQVGDDNRAIEDFNFVLEQEPENMIALYNRALLLDNTGDYRAAIRDISAVIQEYPEFWTGYRTRANIRRKIGDIYGAERDEFKVLKADMEKRTGTYQSKSKTRKKSNRDPNEYNKLVEEDTRLPEKEEYASEYRGRVQDKKTELEVEPMYVLTFNPSKSTLKTYIPFHKLVEAFNRQASFSVPLCLSNAEANTTGLQMDAYFKRITELTTQLAHSPEIPYLCMLRAVDFYHVRDFEAAIQDLDKCLGMNPQNTLAYFLRAQVRYAQLLAGSSSPITPEVEHIIYAQITGDLSKVVELAPDMLYAHYNIGNLYMRRNAYTEAIAEYTRALDIDGRFPEAFYNRGVARLLAGQWEAGLSDLSQAGELGLYAAYNLIKRYSKGKK